MIAVEAIADNGKVSVPQYVRFDDGLERGFRVRVCAHNYNCPPARGTGFSLMSNDAP